MSDNLDSIIKLLQSTYPEKTLVDISDYENEEHQTYKFLYNSLSEKSREQTEEIYNLKFKLDDACQELAGLRDELNLQKSVNSKLNGTATSLMELAKKFSEQEIIISDIKTFNADNNELSDNEKLETLALNTISEQPGIYATRRPSWFLPVKSEFNKNNVARKCAENTKKLLADRLSVLKHILHEINRGNGSKAADSYDKLRKKNILELLQSKCSNEEKYLKYFLLSPGIPKDYINTLVGASELGLDANVVIELLEQPRELFNWEIIELYVSRVHKGTEYNLKKELAEELIRGDWYVTANVNEKNQKFQMAPLELLEELREKMDNICNILSEMADGEVCANLAQTSPDNHQFDNDINEYNMQVEENSFINFDDSMLEDI
jgi:hypothetical protein